MFEDGTAAVLETRARATVSMTEAEVLQLERKRTGSASEADYLRIITQKTASFISACCRIGGLLAKVPEDRVEALTCYGLHIGIAFQISDDSLDFVADQVRLGKAVGADLKRHAAGPGEFEEIRLLVERYGGVQYAQARAQDYASRAKQALATFADGEDKETLLLVADYVVERDK